MAKPCKEDGDMVVAKLIERLRTGDLEALLTIINLFENRVLPSIYQLAGRNDFEDVFRESWLIFRRAVLEGNFDLRRGTIPGYVCTIASNLVNKRSQNIRKEKQAAESLWRINGDCQSDNPEKNAEANEIRNLISQLPVRQQKVYALRYSEDLTYEKIGKKLGIDEATVWRDVAKIHKHMYSALSDEGIKV